jgi:hypothetical protein
MLADKELVERSPVHYNLNGQWTSARKLTPGIGNVFMAGRIEKVEVPPG